MRIKIIGTTIAEEFVSRLKKQGRTEHYIWDAFNEAREILPLTEGAVRRALTRYDLEKRARDYDLSHEKNFRTRVNAKLSQRLESAVEAIREDPAILNVKVFERKTKGYRKLCKNCGTDLSIITAKVRYNQLLAGDLRDGDGEQRCITTEREQFVHYACRGCGATYKR